MMLLHALVLSVLNLGNRRLHTAFNLLKDLGTLSLLISLCLALLIFSKVLLLDDLVEATRLKLIGTLRLENGDFL
jgi:hypothetical protein